MPETSGAKPPSTKGSESEEVKTALLVIMTLGLTAGLAAGAPTRPLPTSDPPPGKDLGLASTWMFRVPTQPPTPQPARAHRTLATASATAQYMRIPMLVVIYTNTAGGTVSPSQITKVQSEVSDGRFFFWRNSHFKCFLDITYMIIDEYKPITDFWEVGPNGYWMGPWGPVEEDLRERGVTNSQYANVFNYYAWGQNGYGAAYGGAAYGPDINFLGRTSYCAVPLCWDPDSSDGLFIHEFLHSLDGMWAACDFLEFPSSDDPIHLAGDFGDWYDFNAYILRSWPVMYWPSLITPFAYATAAVDADADGLADSGAGLPLTESSFGSSTSLADTDGDGMSDFAEAMAGILGSSNPNSPDTDGDGIVDGVDKYPLYPIDPYIPRGTRVIDGSLEASWHLVGAPMNVPQPQFSASIRTNWDPNYLYFAFYFNRWSKLQLWLDADNDGLYHGKDNYVIVVDPARAVGSQVTRAAIYDATWPGGMYDDNPEYTPGRIITESTITCYAWSSGSTYIIELAIPRSTTTKLMPEHGDMIGIYPIYWDVNYQIGKNAFPFEPGAYADLVLINATAWNRVPTIAAAKTNPDGQIVDVNAKVVSARFSGCFYIQEPDRSSGIKVISNASVAAGDRVRAIGRLGTTAGERELQNAVVDKLP
jgi:hypothetical protein